MVAIKHAKEQRTTFSKQNPPPQRNRTVTRRNEPRAIEEDLALSGAAFDRGPAIESKLFPRPGPARGHYRAEGRPNRGRSLRGPQLSGWQLFLL